MPALPRALRPLRHGRYRWLTASLTCSLLSGGLWLLAVVWQTVELGGGPSAVSAVSGSTAGGMLVTTLLGGALADRIPQTRIILAIEAVRTAAIGLVAALGFAGVLSVWHLVVAALVGGLATGMYYPAYSALLPSLLPADQLLAANGFEGALRPVLMQAGGPALAGLVVGAASPAAALALSALAAAAAGVFVLTLPTLAVRRDLSGEAPGNPVAAVLRDVGEGFRYMVRTRWLFATLVFASVMILAVLGPFEVLTPFAVRDRTGGGASQHALVLAAFGIGGAVGSLLTASFRLPRRYLTLMILGWGFGCVPVVVFGLAGQLWPMVLAAAVSGALTNAPMVVWGTLLQRRVPPAMLGRVSSLDFFVSISLLPLSMALAGPVGVRLGLTTTFLLAGLLPPAFAVLTLVAGRLGPDELAHPLDEPARPVPSPGAAPVAGPRPAAPQAGSQAEALTRYTS